MASKIRDFGIPSSVLKGAAMRRAVDAKADELAEAMRSLGVRVEGVPGDVELPVEVSSYTTDRARATVWLAHPSGVAIQAKHGLLSRAASAVGLEVKGE